MGDSEKSVIDQLHNKTGGRPLHPFWKQGNFSLVKDSRNKAQAKCNVCRRTLNNTALARLKVHRKRCPDPSRSQDDADSDLDDSTWPKPARPKRQKLTVLNEAELGERFTEIRQNGRKIAVRCDNCDMVMKNTTYRRLEAHTLRCCKSDFDTSQHDDDELLEDPVGDAEPTQITTDIKIERMPEFVKCNSKEIVEDVVLPVLPLPHTSTAHVVDSDKVAIALADLLYANPTLPWSIVKTETFKVFVGQLNPTAQLPSAKQFSTTYLDKTYKRCISKLRPSETHSILLLHKFTPPGGTAKLVGFLKNHEKQMVFLKHFDFPAYTGPTDDIEKGNSSSLTDFYMTCLQTLCQLAEEKFQTEVFGVVWNNMLGIDETVDASRWHFTSSRYLANQLARQFFNAEMRSNVMDIFGEFKQPELDEKLIESGGAAVQTYEGAETSSLAYLHLCRTLLTDLERLKLIATNKFNKVTPRITKLLFDNYFVSHITDLLSEMTSMEALLTASQDPTASLGDVAQHWLTLEIPSNQNYVNWMQYQRTALNNYSLVANYLHPKYLGSNLTSHHLDVIDEFFLLALSEQGLGSLENLRSKRGVFEMLISKNIQSPMTFWNFAERKNGELAQTALKLFKIPVTAGEPISRLQFPTNDEQLSAEGYEKRLFLYFYLSLGGAK